MMRTVLSCATRSKRASRLLLITLTVVFLPAIAFASPPDPSWIMGVYDGADGDDIVTLIADQAATNAPSLPLIPPPLPLSERLFRLKPDAVQSLRPGQQTTRGPPSGLICISAAVSSFKSVSHSGPAIFRRTLPVCHRLPLSGASSPTDERTTSSVLTTWSNAVNNE